METLNLASRIAKHQCSGSDAKSLIHFEAKDNSTDTLSKAAAKRQCSGSDAKSLINFEVKEDSADTQSEKKAAAAASKKKKEQLQNHQFKHRQKLLDIKKNQQDIALEEQEKAREQIKKKENRKQKNYGHVKSKIFNTRDISSASTSTTATTSSTITSMDSMLSQSSRTYDRRDSNGFNEQIQQQREFCSERVKHSSERHRSFGRVPKYILERRVAAQEEMRQKEKQAISITVATAKKCNANNYLERPMQPKGLVRMKESERNQAIQKLSETEKKLRLALMKFPFSLQNVGSIKKRKALEQQLSEVEDAKKKLLL